MKKILSGLLLGVVVLLTGCFETKQEFTINPDGSGKVVHESSFQKADFSEQSADAEKELREAVKKMLSNAKGVEAWRDLTYKQSDDGRIVFRGTAYFKDLSKLSLPNQTFMEFIWKTNADGSAALDVKTNKPGATGDGFSMSPVRKAPSAKPLTPEEKARKIKLDRAKFKQSKPMLLAFLGTMKQETVLHLPGKITASSNFQIEPSGALKISLEGSKMVEVMDKLINNDAWIQEHGDEFDNMQEKPGLNEEMNQALFGEKAPVRAVLAAQSKPLFDYAAEAAEAKKEFSVKYKNLVSTLEPVGPPAQGGEFKSLKVAGVRFVMETDKERGLRPFSQETTSYTLALTGELPGSVMEMRGGVVEVADADDGSSLLQEKEWSRKINFPALSKDKNAVVFEVALKAPGAKVKGLKEVSGHLEYRTAEGTVEAELGFSEIKAGASGTNFDAEIKSIKEGWKKDGSEELELKVSLDAANIKNLSLVDASGVKKTLERRSYGGGNGRYVITYDSKEKLPTNGRLVVELFDKVKNYEIPFKLQNINLMGASLSK